MLASRSGNHGVMNEHVISLLVRRGETHRPSLVVVVIGDEASVATRRRRVEMPHLFVEEMAD